jgi:hypothetical protein
MLGRNQATQPAGPRPYPFLLYYSIYSFTLYYLYDILTANPLIRNGKKI